MFDLIIFSVLLLAAASPLPAVAATTISNDRDNQAALKDISKPLKTKMPVADDKKAPLYIIELRASQTVKPIGQSPVNAVEQSQGQQPSEIINLKNNNNKTGVTIERPPLSALIRIEDNLNPFSFDAKHIEKIDLKEALAAALNQNLDIEDAYAGMRSRKYAYLSAATGFLPSLNAGYSLFGVSGSIPGTLFGGSSTSPSSGAGNASQQMRLPSSIQLLNAGFTYTAYQGGRVTFGTLEQKHRARAARAALKTNVNDTLLNVSKRYYDLLLNEALLAIRTRAVSISQEQLRLNTALEKAGSATGLDVLQSQAQLASDEQNLIDQQNARRQAAIQLAHVLNTSYTLDLESREHHLEKRRLLPESATVEQLLSLAIDRRPELKQYEELRLAAKRAIVVAGAPLHPSVALAGSVYGIGTGGSKVDPIYTLNLGIKWSLGGLGTTDAMNIQKARWDARQAAIQAKKIFLDVFQEVRSSYNNSLASDKRIDRASLQILAAEEELRIARKRMESGIGLNIDVLNAQRDLTQASINKARAVVDFNIAQAQLLHDIGTISAASLINGTRL